MAIIYKMIWRGSENVGVKREPRIAFIVFNLLCPLHLVHSPYPGGAVVTL